MAIIYSYPEIPDVQGGDLLLISDTGAPNKPTRSVDIDDLAAYIGTVVGVVQNLQSVLTVGNTYVSPDGYGTFTLDVLTANNAGNIKYLNTDEGWGYFLNAEEGLFFTDGTGSQTGGTGIGLGYVSIGNSNHIGKIRSVNITADRTYQLPNASGTIALTSDIPAPGPSGSGTANYTARWTDSDTLGIGALYDNGTNVGIGTTNPTQKLEVNGTVLFSTLPGNNGRLCLGDVSTNLFSNAASGHLYISTNNSSRMTILDNGNVGIGTTSPSDKLHVSAGAIRLDNFYQLRWGGTGTGIYGHSSQGLNFYTDSGTTRLKIENSGNVGIGTTSPSQKLTVLGVGSFGTSTSQTLIDYDGLNAVGNTDYIRFKVDNSEKLRITSAGNVGIGTTSPAYILDVVSAGTATARLKSAGTGAISLRYENGGGFKSAAVVDNNGLYRLDATNISLNPTNNVGIGTTSPSDKLSVAGNLSTFHSGHTTKALRVTMNSNDALLSLYSRTNQSSQQVLLRTNGNSYLNGGNVGIGTTSPESKLQVSGSGNESVEIKVSGGTTAGNTGSISLSRTDGAGSIIQGAAFLGGGVPIGGIAGGIVGSSNTSAPAFAIQTPNSTNGHIVFNPKGTETMRITSAGNVGIGTTNPGTKLHISGGIITVNDGTGITYYEGNKINSYNANGYNIIGREGLTLSTASSDKDIILSPTGNVGIGTTSPGYKLDVSGTGQVTSRIISTDNSGARFDLHSSGGGRYSQQALANGDFFMYDETSGHTIQRYFDGASGAWAWYTVGTERMRINSSGNVGIGTTSPSKKLHVNGGARIEGASTVNGSLTVENGQPFYLTGPTYLTLQHNGVGGSIVNSTGDLVISNSAGNKDIIFKSSASLNPVEIMRIDGSSGSIGIGTTSPTTKLHVNGDIRIQGENELYFGGTGSVPHWEITASGSDLIVNDTGTNVGSVLFNNDEGVALPRLTTTEINAISSPAQGLMAYNTTLNTICFYNGSSWQKVSHTSM